MSFVGIGICFSFAYTAFVAFMVGREINEIEIYKRDCLRRREDLERAAKEQK